MSSHINRPMPIEESAVLEQLFNPAAEPWVSELDTVSELVICAGTEGWQPLSEIVRHLQERARRAGLVPCPADQTLFQQQQALTFDSFGDRLRWLPAGNVLAGVALRTVTRLVAHRIRPGVVRTVDSTDLHSLPGEAPHLLRGAFCLEAHRPETGDRLFGDVVGLAGFPLEHESGQQVLAIFAWGYPHGCAVIFWHPVWTGGEMPDVATSLARESVFGAGGGWAREAVRFLVTYSLLLQAKGAPLRESDERAAEPAASRRLPAEGRGGKPLPPWTVHHVTLDDRRIAAARAARRSAPGAGPPADARLLDTWVDGFLRRYHVGEGRSRIEWRYIPGHEARRWMGPRPCRIVVSASTKQS